MLCDFFAYSSSAIQILNSEIVVYGLTFGFNPVHIYSKAPSI